MTCEEDEDDLYDAVRHFRESHYKPQNINTMSDTPKEKKTRTPRNYDNILKGAMSLELNEKVALVKALKEDIMNHVKEADAAAQAAKETVNGL